MESKIMWGERGSGSKKWYLEIEKWKLKKKEVD